MNRLILINLSFIYLRNIRFAYGGKSISNVSQLESTNSLGGDLTKELNRIVEGGSNGTPVRIMDAKAQNVNRGTPAYTPATSTGSMDRYGMGPSPLGPAQMGPSPLGPAQMGPSPLGPAQMGPSPIGPAQMGPSHGAARVQVQTQPTARPYLQNYYQAPPPYSPPGVPTVTGAAEQVGRPNLEARISPIPYQQQNEDEGYGQRESPKQKAENNPNVQKKEYSLTVTETITKEGPERPPRRRRNRHPGRRSRISQMGGNSMMSEGYSHGPTSQLSYGRIARRHSTMAPNVQRFLQSESAPYGSMESTMVSQTGSYSDSGYLTENMNNAMMMNNQRQLQQEKAVMDMRTDNASRIILMCAGTAAMAVLCVQALRLSGGGGKSST